MKQLLLSIITVNLNNNTGLAKTLQNIKQQSFDSYEHIIIDGGSTDGSKEEIDRYSKENHHLTYWISEKDSGVYNAMNKGILQAQGEYLLFLNSGDYLELDILNKVSEQLSGEDIIYGDLYFTSSKEDNKVLQQFPSPPFSTTQVISPNFYLPHPASFIRRDLFKDEKYNEHYKIVSDWEFCIKSIVLKNCTIRHIPLPISNFEEGGLSSITENKILILSEREDVLQQLFSPKIIESLRSLATVEQSPLYEVIFLLRHTQHFQRRIRKLILFLYKMRCIFTKKK